MAANRVNSRLFSDFEKIGLHREIKPPKWNLALVLKSLTQLPFEPPELSLDKRLTWKSCFLLALTLAKRVGELCSFLYWVRYLRSWRSCSLSLVPEFVAKTRNPFVSEPRFEEFTVSFHLLILWMGMKTKCCFFLSEP